jgi:hypothetical protein
MPQRPSNKQDPKWKKFEKVIAGIHILSDSEALVKFNDHIQGKKTGRRLQVDVSMSFKRGFYPYLVIIECKDLTRRVSITDVQAFNTKIDDLGAEKGVIVSANGFQKGAVRTAEVYGIELHTLKEEPGEWLNKIIVPMQSINFPVWFSIDTKDVPSYPGNENISLEDFIFYGATGEIIPIKQLIAVIMEESVKQKKSYPLEVRWQFDQPMQIQLPDFQSPTEAYGVDFRIDDLDIRTELCEIPVTPQGINYVYSNVNKQKRNIFPAEQLPIGVDTVFECGKYYKNQLGMKYRCIKITGDMALLLLIDYEKGGDNYCVEFWIGIKSSQYYVPLNDLEDEKILERSYRKLENLA